jgi:hypothetical protein
VHKKVSGCGCDRCLGRYTVFIAAPKISSCSEATIEENVTYSLSGELVEIEGRCLARQSAHTISRNRPRLFIALL